MLKVALHEFLRKETGGIAAEWTTMAAGVIGLGLASVTAVRMGAITLGATTNSAVTAPAPAFQPIYASMPGTAPDPTPVFMPYQADISLSGRDTLDYVPLATSQAQIDDYLYSMIGSPEGDLRDIYTSYLTAANDLANAGMILPAAQHLDVAGLAYTLLHEAGLAIPDVGVDFHDLYARVSSMI